MLLDAELIDDFEAEFNLWVIESNTSWLNEQGEVVDTWLQENFS